MLSHLSHRNSYLSNLALAVTRVGGIIILVVILGDVGRLLHADQLRVDLESQIMLAQEIDSGDAKIKMYHDAEGNFKGEALVVYFRPESVSLAIEMLDETDFRFGVTAPGGPMLVEVADYSYKATQPEPANRPQRSKKDQEKIKERTKRLNRYVHESSKVLFPMLTRPC